MIRDDKTKKIRAAIRDDQTDDRCGISVKCEKIFCHILVLNLSHEAHPQFSPHQQLKLIMSNVAIPVDIENLGTGRYSGKTFKDALQIPDTVCHLIPAREASIPILLAHSLPSVLDASGGDLLMAQECFVDQDPTWDIASLAGAPLPPSSWIGLFDAQLKRRWVTGEPVDSIRHPSIQSLLFPVWVLRYWEEALLASREQRRWAEAVKWIGQREESPLRARVIEALERIPWGLELRPDGDPDPDRLVGNLADLLSWGWVRETHMEVASRMFNSTCRGSWVVADPFIAIRLGQVSKLSDGDIAKDTTLGDIALLAKHNNATNIVFPVNINNCHWVVYHVDLDHCNYKHGMCPLCRHHR